MIAVRTPVDRAVRGLGLLALAAAATTLGRGELDPFQVRGWGLVVTLALGLLGLLAGVTARRWLALVAGAGFLAAAVVQISQLGGRAGDVTPGVLGGNAATFALWLGLGVGLAVLGLTRDPAAPGPARRSGPTGPEDSDRIVAQGGTDGSHRTP